MKGNQAKTIRPEPEKREPGPHAAGQRRRLAASAELPLAELPGDELTPKVRSAVMQLMDELDRVRDELVAANERVTELESMADEDPLVPVLNRRGFERELERILAYVKRYGTTVTLVYLDLDDFKGVNDRYGHAGGDAALKHFADMLLANVRRSDLVGRLGGDEFAIILHRADLNATAAKAAQLAAQVAVSPAPHDGGEIPLSITWGAAELQGDDSVESVLERADKAMYEGKARRRAQRAAGS
ncbi:MAG: GGDEF domain-containing protein [Pirellulales bacterium]|nr:GGDEF domain-containing protein [Pirellulales bacterium]